MHTYAYIYLDIAIYVYYTVAYSNAYITYRIAIYYSYSMLIQVYIAIANILGHTYDGPTL